jgi:mycothiol synthase
MAAATTTEPGSYVAWGPAAAPIDERRALAFVREYQVARRRGHRLALAVHAGGGALVGSVILIRAREDEAEVAYWIRSEARGRGYATRALGLAADWALSHGFRRLWLEIEPRNVASLRVAVKTGFRYTGQHVCGIGGLRVECAIYVRAASAADDSQGDSRRNGEPAREAGREVRTTPGAPPGFTASRPTLADLDRVLALINAAESTDCGRPDTTRGDLVADWQGLPHFSLERDAWLVSDALDRLVGYAWEWNEHDHGQLVAEYTVLPAIRGLGVEEYLLTLIEERAAEHAARAPGAAARLGLFAMEADRPKLECYGQRGFRHIRTFERMTIDLNRPPAPPPWPAGVQVRPFRRGLDDASVHAAAHEAFREHFRDAPLPLADWQRLAFANPEIDLGLWFVAWNGEQVAGYVLARVRTGLAYGHIDELGVRPQWRRQGLGMALLLHSLGSLHKRGLRRAVLGVDADNVTGASRLYRRAGMRVERRVLFYEKVVRAAQPGS